MERETSLQMACTSWFKYTFKNILYWHTANERKTSLARGAKLKKMGVLSGVPDIIIYHKEQLYCIELKVGYNKLTDNQKEFLDRAEKNGAICKVIKSVDEFIGFCNINFRHSKYYRDKNRNRNKQNYMITQKEFFKSTLISRHRYFNNYLRNLTKFFDESFYIVTDDQRMRLEQEIKHVSRIVRILKPVYAYSTEK